MDSGRLERVGQLTEIKTIEKPSSVDHFMPDEGGLLLGIRLYSFQFSHGMFVCYLLLNKFVVNVKAEEVFKPIFLKQRVSHLFQSLTWLEG